MQNAINWFELPSSDFDRAVGFYEKVLKVQMRREVAGGMPTGIFPADQTGAGGAIVFGDSYQPSANQGALIYLNAETEANLDTVLSRVPTSGGKVVLPKMDIGNPGFIAIILDSEGNKVGLHAPRG